MPFILSVLFKELLVAQSFQNEIPKARINIGKKTMEEVAAIKNIGTYFDRAEYTEWQAFRDSDDAGYIYIQVSQMLKAKG